MNITLLDLTLYGNSMIGYNSTAIGEDRATLGSDPSALMVAYSMGRHLQWYRPVLAICWCPKSDKSFCDHVLINQLFWSWTWIFSFENGGLKPTLRMVSSLLSSFEISCCIVISYVIDFKKTRTKNKELKDCITE